MKKEKEFFAFSCHGIWMKMKRKKNSIKLFNIHFNQGEGIGLASHNVLFDGEWERKKEMSDTDFHSLKNCFFTLLRMLVLFLLLYCYYLIHSLFHKFSVYTTMTQSSTLSGCYKKWNWKRGKIGIQVTKVYVNWKLIEIFCAMIKK